MKDSFIMSEVGGLVRSYVEVNGHVDISICTRQDGGEEGTDSLRTRRGELRIEEVPQRDEHRHFLRLGTSPWLDELQEAR